jgi:hypothetical protein
MPVGLFVLQTDLAEKNKLLHHPEVVSLTRKMYGRMKTNLTASAANRF